MVHNLVWPGLKKDPAIADEDIAVKENEAELDADLEGLVGGAQAKEIPAEADQKALHFEWIKNG